eukprot:TRINITY_DN0_c358_g1_i4.p1 TRINITY_DN0_c358_g1~~TRINITY_DN0_c358_g1_i4.p1  ORF type:complete len:151 (+),score=39.52 TRINITY_DN0_c358_g1_i4:29-481(+)
MIPRIGKEYNDISKTPIPHVTVTLPDKSSMAVWHCVIDGPIGTPYAGGKFVLQLDFSDNYPFKSPKIKFLTKIYHPNIRQENGEICDQLIKDQWKPTMTARSVVNTLVKLIENPDLESPIEQEIAKELKENKKAYKTKAAEYTKKYATGK